MRYGTYGRYSFTRNRYKQRKIGRYIFGAIVLLSCIALDYYTAQNMVYYESLINYNYLQ